MFWILKKSTGPFRSTFFNSINNNSLIINNGYNKLGGADDENKNQTKDDTINTSQSRVAPHIVTSLSPVHSRDRDSDSSSFSDLDPDDFSQDSDYEENLTCNVCDRFFFSQNQLIQHQQKKRHFGCWSCDSLFPTLSALENHKDENDHWSGDERPQHHHSDNDSDSTSVSHELDRLL